MALASDLVLAFSDLQAGSSRTSPAPASPSICSTSATWPASSRWSALGALIDRRDAANTLADSLARRLEAIARQQQHRSPRPRVFFEEWDEPLIAGIGWVSELIEIAGGSEPAAIFARRRRGQGPIVTPDAIAATRPDVILASGAARRSCRSYPVPSRLGSDPRRCREPDLRNQVAADLQPGPAALTEGLDAILAALESHDCLDEAYVPFFGAFGIAWGDAIERQSPLDVVAGDGCHVGNLRRRQWGPPAGAAPAGSSSL